MLFNSYPFLFGFLPIVFLIFCLLRALPRHRLHFLTLASYVFYGYWNYKFIPLLFLSTALDFFIAQKMANLSLKSERKKYLLISVVFNLALLGFFKYFYFALNSANTVLNFAGLELLLPDWQIILPVGISFYTFQSMSYTIDIYRNSSKPYTDFTAFCCYVSFFPQLIAGPIIRHEHLVPQLIQSLRTHPTSRQYAHAIRFFVLGLSKKILIADRLAAAVDPALLQLNFLSTLEAWLCAIGYSLQLYFDFSGYSDMAIGLGFLFGLQFPQNFNSPYRSISITDFWRRWHMTLSSWLRDYLYISLGGNRKGQIRTYINLILTMLLGGLWHGAGWNYFVWGGYHGTLLACERAIDFEKQKFPAFFKRAIALTLVVVGWVFFRSSDLNMAWEWLDRMFSWQYGFTLHNFRASVRDRFIAVFVVGVFIIFRKKNTYTDFDSIKFNLAHSIYYAILLVACLLYLAEESPFLYFQF